MAEYIDREATCKECLHYDVCYLIEHYGADEYELCDHFTPTADVVEVRHGHWIYWRDADGFKQCKCSECIISYGCIDTPYCPNCGAKMDGKGEG